MYVYIRCIYMNREVMIMYTLTSIVYCTCGAGCEVMWYTFGIQSHFTYTLLDCVESGWAINWMRTSMKLLSH